jgi:hypothetical protein
MSPRPVVVVGETPSLGRSIGDLLLAAGIPCRMVSDLTVREVDSWKAGGAPLILVACNEAYCRTARRWAHGEFPGTALVVVGARDPSLHETRGAHVVTLPLQREPLLTLIRGLTSDPPPP